MAGLASIMNARRVPIATIQPPLDRLITGLDNLLLDNSQPRQVHGATNATPSATQATFAAASSGPTRPAPATEPAATVCHHRRVLWQHNIVRGAWLAPHARPSCRWQLCRILPL
jgi:uncharacterized membrane protein YccC